MEDKIMKYEAKKSLKYRRAFSFLLILIFAVQLVLLFDIDETFAEGNNTSGSTAVDENISYTGSYTLTGQEMNEYINSWKSNHPDIVNPDANDPDAEQAAAAVIPWAGGKYGEYRVATQTIRYRTVENGVEVFKPVKRRVIFLGLTVTGAVPNVTIGAEQSTAKVTRYIDEDGNTVKEAGTFGFLDADQYIYDAGGKIAYVFKNTLPDTSDIRTHVYTKYVEPVSNTPQIQKVPKPKVSKSSVPSRPGISKVKKASSRITPKTADNTGIAFYSGLLGLSIASVMLIMMKKKFTLSK
ncbi:hypothetical protein [Mogibacterium sp.]